MKVLIVVAILFACICIQAAPLEKYPPTSSFQDVGSTEFSVIESSAVRNGYKIISGKNVGKTNTIVYYKAPTAGPVLLTYPVTVTIYVGLLSTGVPVIAGYASTASVLASGLTVNQASGFLWVNPGDDPSNYQAINPTGTANVGANVIGVKVLADDTIVVVGSFTGTLGQITADSSGRAVFWATSKSNIPLAYRSIPITSTTVAQAYDFAVDEFDNAYITGMFSGSMNSLPDSAGGIFVAKVRSKSATVVFVEQIAGVVGAADPMVTSISVSSKSIFLTGLTSSSLTFGAKSTGAQIVLATSPQPRMFVASLDRTNAAYQWGKSYVSSTGTQGNLLNVVFGTSSPSTTDLFLGGVVSGTGSGLASGLPDTNAAFVTKLSGNSGDQIWTKSGNQASSTTSLNLVSNGISSSFHAFGQHSTASFAFDDVGTDTFSGLNFHLNVTDGYYACPFNEPFFCGGNECFSSATLCYKNKTCGGNERVCANGQCSVNNTCPLENPSDLCPSDAVSVACPAAGICVTEQPQCQGNCPSGQLRCYDNSCSSDCPEPPISGGIGVIDYFPPNATNPNGSGDDDVDLPDPDGDSPGTITLPPGIFGNSSGDGGRIKLTIGPGNTGLGAVNLPPNSAVVSVVVSVVGPAVIPTPFAKAYSVALDVFIPDSWSQSGYDLCLATVDDSQDRWNCVDNQITISSNNKRAANVADGRAQGKTSYFGTYSFIATQRIAIEEEDDSSASSVSVSIAALFISLIALLF